MLEGFILKLPELLSDLQKFTKEEISQTALGIAMGNLKRQTIYTRLNNNSEVTVTELLNAQKNFNVEIYTRTDDPDKNITKNSLIKQNDTSLLEKYETIGERLDLIQDKNNISDSKMSKLLRISEEEYLEIKCGDLEIDTETLFKIKQNFEISIDWLLWG